MIAAVAQLRSGKRLFVTAHGARFEQLGYGLRSLDKGSIHFGEKANPDADFPSSDHADEWINRFHSDQEWMDDNHVSFFETIWVKDEVFVRS
jgi:hypothetical protein